MGGEVERRKTLHTNPWPCSLVGGRLLLTLLASLTVAASSCTQTGSASSSRTIATTQSTLPIETDATNPEGPRIDFGDSPAETTAPEPEEIDFEVSAEAIGPVRLGQPTLDLGKTLPSEFRIGPALDAEGLEAFELFRGDEVMLLINQNDGLVVGIHGVHPEVTLPNGMKPGMKLRDAAKIAGDPELVFAVEARTFADFPNDADIPGLQIRATTESGGPVGLFSDFQIGETTTRYDPSDAKIHWIGISY